MLMHSVASRQAFGGGAGRCLSTSSTASAAARRAKAFVSASHHPHFNLSLEHHLLRTQPTDVPVGLLYRNEACIVIGRNQNPWRELDVSSMRKLGIRVVRRRSGGGAVYHDLGNTNYSFHVAREQFTRRTHAELVARALNGPPIYLKNTRSTSDLGDAGRGAYVNERNDICVRLLRSGTADEERKVSGSAYKITSSRAYHHGTMLLSSNLTDLGNALRPSRAAMDSKGVASVPSPVVNLAQAFPSRQAHLNHDQFCEAVLSEFQRTYGTADVHYSVTEDNVGSAIHGDGNDDGQLQDLLKGWREMDSWDWMWGQTPEFTHRVRSDGERALLVGDFDALPSFEIDLHVKHGLVQEAKVRMDDLNVHDDDLTRLVARLPSRRYDVLANAPDTFGGNNDDSQRATGDAGLDVVLRHVGIDSTDRSREAAVARQLLPWLKTVL